MINVMVVFGTRPEAIKVVPVIKELEARKETNPIVCVTAQHREMLDQILQEFDIQADYDLNIMQQGQTLAEITTKALVGLEKIIKEVKPDIVLVHGDTTTTFAGALAAFYNGTTIGHLEAGLRTYNKFSPYPEEMNRQMVSVLADIHFAPTHKSKQNLLREAKKKNIYVTGNTAIDALKLTIKEDYKNPQIDDFKEKERIILLTSHRRENIGTPMENIFKAVKKIVEEYEDVKVIYPVHKNPKVREIANRILTGNSRIKLIEPLDVIDFHNLMNKSYLILTDSGGIQEEAPSLGKPVLVLRDTTERPEGIRVGTLKLVGTDEEEIYKQTKLLLDNKEEYNKMAKNDKKQATRTTIDELNEKLSAAERRVEGNKKMILWAIIGILVVIGIGLWYYYGVHQANINESKEAVGKADIAMMAGNDSLALKQYQAAAAQHSNKYANRANLEAAAILYQQGKFAEAVKYLDQYDAEESFVGSLAKALQGDCNVNLKKYDEAVKCYDEAVEIADGNKMLIPYALTKKATVLSAQNKHKEAAAIYEEIKYKYPEFNASNRIDINTLLERENFRASKK